MKLQINAENCAKIKALFVTYDITIETSSFVTKILLRPIQSYLYANLNFQRVIRNRRIEHSKPTICSYENISQLSNGAFLWDDPDQDQ